MPPPGGSNQAQGLTTALQPLNVQMAELVGAVKELNAAATGTAAATQQAAAGGLSMSSAISAVSAGISKASSVSTLAAGELTRFASVVSSTVGGFVEAFSPVTMQRFTFAVRDLTASIGEILLPVLDRFRVVFRGIGDTIASLSSPARSMIAALAAGGVAMVVMTAATVAFSTAVNSATFGLSAVLGAVAGLATGTVFLAGTMDEFGEVVRAVSVVARQVMESLGGAFGKVSAAVLPLVGQFGELAGKLVGPVVETVGRLAETFAGLAASVLPVVSGLLGAVLPLNTALMRVSAVVLDLAVTALRPLFAVVEALMPVVQILLTPLTTAMQLLGTLGGLFADVLGPALDVALIPLRLLGEFFGLIAAEVSGALGELQDAFSEVATLAGEVAAELAAVFRELFDALRPVLAELGGALLTPLRVLTGMIRAVADGITFLVESLRDLLGMPAAEAVDPTGKSQGKAFRQVSTGSAESLLSKMQESAYGLGQAADPQRQTARHTGVMVQALNNIKTAIENLPADLASAIVENMRERVRETADRGTGSGAFGAGGLVAREIMGRVLG